MQHILMILILVTRGGFLLAYTTNLSAKARRRNHQTSILGINVANTEHSGEVAMAAAKLTPPITVTGMTLAGYTLQDWVLLATLAYTVLQICITVYRLYKEHRGTKP